MLRESGSATALVGSPTDPSMDSGPPRAHLEANGAGLRRAPLVLPKGLLTRRSEVRLASEMAPWVQMRRHLRNPNIRPAPQCSPARLARARLAWERFFEANLRLVPYCFRGLALQGSDKDDLLQEGHIAMMEAMEWFDPARGARFATLAIEMIRQRAYSSFKTSDQAIRVSPHTHRLVKLVSRVDERLRSELGRTPDAEETALRLQEEGHSITARQVGNARNARQFVVSLNSPTSGEGDGGEFGDSVAAGSVERAFHDEEAGYDPEVLSSLLARLGDRERDMVERRFGLFGREKQTLETVGQEYSLTREAVRQIVEKALVRLRGEPEARELERYLDSLDGVEVDSSDSGGARPEPSGSSPVPSDIDGDPWSVIGNAKPVVPGCWLCSCPSSLHDELWSAFGPERDGGRVIELATASGAVDLSERAVGTHFANHSFEQPWPDERPEDGELIDHVAGLPPRYREILLAVAVHRVLTSEQISRLFFAGSTKDRNTEQKAAYRTLRKLAFGQLLHAHSRTDGGRAVLAYSLGLHAVPWVLTQLPEALHQRVIDQTSAPACAPTLEELSTAGFFVALREQLFPTRGFRPIPCGGKALAPELPVDGWLPGSLMEMSYTIDSGDELSVRPAAFASLTVGKGGDGRPRQLFLITADPSWSTDQLADHLMAHVRAQAQGAVSSMDWIGGSGPVALLVAAGSGVDGQEVARKLAGRIAGQFPSRDLVPTIVLTDRESIGAGAWTAEWDVVGNGGRAVGKATLIDALLAPEAVPAVLSHAWTHASSLVCR